MRELKVGDTLSYMGEEWRVTKVTPARALIEPQQRRKVAYKAVDSATGAFRDVEFETAGRAVSIARRVDDPA